MYLLNVTLGLLAVLWRMSGTESEEDTAQNSESSQCEHRSIGDAQLQAPSSRVPFPPMFLNMPFVKRLL